MPEKNKITFLKDSKVLIQAYAASSPYVMLEVFKRIKQFDQLKGRKDFASIVQQKLSALIKKPKYPVLIAAHLYALELIGQTQELRSAASHVLANKTLINDPIVGQFAGQIAYRLLYPRRKQDLNVFISMGEMKKIVAALKKSGGIK